MKINVQFTKLKLTKRITFKLQLSFLLLMISIPLQAIESAKPESKHSTEKSADEATEFLRVKRDDKLQSLSFDTAIVRYKSNSGITVDLVAAVHIADEDYYKNLNSQFESYDAVLYELVAAKGTKIQRDRKPENTSMLTKAQQSMKDMLDLSFQLTMIDYNKDNFVHADMSPEQFSKSMDDKGESFSSMFFKLMLQSMAMQNSNSGVSDLHLIFAFMADDRAMQLKKVLALQFENMGSTILALEGEDGSTIINERNNEALKVLKQQIALDNKHFAIFYGAGHMPDLEKKLLRDFDMTVVSHQWLAAWDLTR